MFVSVKKGSSMGDILESRLGLGVRDVLGFEQTEADKADWAAVEPPGESTWLCSLHISLKQTYQHFPGISLK